MTLVSINITDENIEELDSKRVNRSCFMRQAIEAENKGQWKYEHRKRSSKNKNKSETPNP